MATDAVAELSTNGTCLDDCFTVTDGYSQLHSPTFVPHQFPISSAQYAIKIGIVALTQSMPAQGWLLLVYWLLFFFDSPDILADILKPYLGEIWQEVIAVLETDTDRDILYDALEILRPFVAESNGGFTFHMSYM
jgi:hypothetical protein